MDWMMADGFRKLIAETQRRTFEAENQQKKMMMIKCNDKPL